jgi:hypothetical protein
MQDLDTNTCAVSRSGERTKRKRRKKGWECKRCQKEKEKLNLKQKEITKLLTKNPFKSGLFLKALGPVLQHCKTLFYLYYKRLSLKLKRF